PWMPAEPVWLNIGKERQIVADQNTLLDIAFLQHGLDRARAVCRLVVECGRQSWHGTGFRVGERTLLTNHHVLYDGTAPATAVYAQFGYELGTDGNLRTPLEVRCNTGTIAGEIQDDFAIVKTAEPLPADLPVLSLRDGPRPKPYDRVSIIQHPKGLPKKIAMHHNLVLHSADDVLQYWTDTDYGSSGSPVFDEEWRVVALHHQWVEVNDGSGVAFRNQGRTISRVVERLDALSVNFED
ncbi:MAG TPA: serine protease, partial [Lentzea sp.]